MHNFCCFMCLMWFFVSSDLLCARGLVSFHPDTGPDSDHWQKTGSAPWRTNVWPAVVGPWRYVQINIWLETAMYNAAVCVTSFLSALRHHGVGGESQGGRLLIRERRGGSVQRRQRHPHDLSSTSVSHGGLQVALQWDGAHGVVSPQLLLQVHGYINLMLSLLAAISRGLKLKEMQDCIKA